MLVDERKQKILGAVVRDYVETIRPVGSEDLAARHAWGVKSATIRHELAELAEMGYLIQPHTSAGRIPSDRGYRFYVDHLMIVKEAGEAESAPEECSDYILERVLRQTCALLTRMTSYTSVATPPRRSDTSLSKIFLTSIGDNRLLLVVVLSTGQVENRLMTDSPDVPAPDLDSIANALNAAIAGKTLDIVDHAGPDPAPINFRPAMRTLFDTLHQAVRQVAAQASDDVNFYLEGAHEILKQPEFRDVGKIESMLGTLQRGHLVFQSLSRALLAPDVTVIIGNENEVQALQECSVVTASYYVGTRERGTIGVIGPTRMDYDRAVPAVGFFARSLSQTLTQISAI